MNIDQSLRLAGLTTSIALASLVVVLADGRYNYVSDRLALSVPILDVIGSLLKLANSFDSVIGPVPASVAYAVGRVTSVGKTIGITYITWKVIQAIMPIDFKRLEKPNHALAISIVVADVFQASVSGYIYIAKTLTVQVASGMQDVSEAANVLRLTLRLLQVTALTVLFIMASRSRVASDKLKRLRERQVKVNVGITVLTFVNYIFSIGTLAKIPNIAQLVTNNLTAAVQDLISLAQLNKLMEHSDVPTTTTGSHDRAARADVAAAKNRVSVSGERTSLRQRSFVE